MDQNDRFSSQKSEPSLDEADAFSTAPPAEVPVTPAPPVDNIEAGDMPSWLTQPGEEVDTPTRWQRTGLWVGGCALLIAAAAVGSNWLLEQQEASSVAEVPGELAPAPVQAQLPAPVVVPQRPAGALPPLVLLPPEQGGKAPASAPVVPAAPVDSAEVAPAPAPAELPPPVVVKSKPAPAVAKPLPEPVVVKSAPAPAVPKPAPEAAVVKATPAPAVVKPPLKPVTRVAAKPAAKPAAVAAKKKPVVARRAAPKPAPKKIAGTMLPPPRERARDSEPDAAPVRKCIPGELARECEARLKQR